MNQIGPIAPRPTIMAAMGFYFRWMRLMATPWLK